MRKLTFLIGMVALLGACCNQNNKTTNTETKTAKECASISVDSFLVVAGDFVGKELSVNGTVDHVCKHGGKRVRIFSSDPSKSIHGEASEKVGAFNVELEGSDVCLTGTVLETKIDEVYINDWETKEKEAMANKAEESEMKHKEGVDHHANLEQIKKYREQIAASDKGYISFYALEVTDYHECNTIENDGCGSKTDSSAVNAPCCGDKKEETKPCCDEKKEGEVKPCGAKS